jgi:hypothetical protein
MEAIMKIKMQELTTLTFGGPSFEDHGLEIDVLPELVQYKKILAETAETLWRQTHQDRERLPKGFKETLRIKFYNLAEGSTAIPLFREIQYEENQLPFEYEDELNQAVDLVEEVMESSCEDKPLPENFPKNVLPLFENLGKTLGENDYIQLMSVKRQKPVTFTNHVRENLVNLEAKTYEDLVDLTGEVRLADLDGLNFKVRLDDGAKIDGKFEAKFEPMIIGALKDHATCRLSIKGLGQFNHRDNYLQKIVRVDEMEIQEAGALEYDKTARPVWEVITEIGSEVPEEDWGKVPKDLSKELDHYLYGSPRSEN